MKPGIDYIGITTPFYCHDGDGNFLLHKRSNACRDEQGYWDFGGGRLQFGEDPAEGVLREVYEEYGCQGEIQEQLPAHSIIRTINSQKTHWLAVPFIIKVNRDEVKLNDKDKITEIGWFKLNKLPEPLHTGVQYTMSKFKYYLEKYSHKKKL